MDIKKIVIVNAIKRIYKMWKRKDKCEESKRIAKNMMYGGILRIDKNTRNLQKY